MSANFIFLHKRGSSTPVQLDKGQTEVEISPGDSFSLSGDFYRVALESETTQYEPPQIEKSSSLQKFPTAIVSDASDLFRPSDSSSQSTPAGSAHSIEVKRTEAVIKAPRIDKRAGSNGSSEPAKSAEAEEERPLAHSWSTKHETVFLNYESDSVEEGAPPAQAEVDSLEAAAAKPHKSQGDSPAKVSKKRKEREEEAAAVAAAAAAAIAEGAEEPDAAVQPRRSKRQRVELYNMDSILDERDEDMMEQDDFGRKGRGAKKAKAKANDKLQQILSLFSAKDFSSTAKLALFYHEECLNHVTPDDHLEQPGRLRVAIEAINLLKENFGKADSVVVEANSWFPIALEPVARVHGMPYLEKMRQRAEKMQPEDLPRHGTLQMTQDTFGSQIFSQSSSSAASVHVLLPLTCLSAADAPKDTFISFGSWNAALLAAGGVCKAVEFVCAPGDQRRARNAFVAVRPPGHHAGPSGHARSNTQGFCILNNVAIGAKYAMDKFGLQRVAIVDIDVHAGNGTVECVEKEPNILFISMHCEEAYPFDAEHTPAMYNLGPNILNVGFKSNPTRRKFFKLFEEQALPRLEAQKPELILISAGFDAHAEDPTGVGALTSQDYVDLTEKLKDVAERHSNGRVVSVLEGGYNLDALKQSVLAHICSLMRSTKGPEKSNSRKGIAKSK